MLPSLPRDDKLIRQILALETLGIELTERGTIEVNDYMQTRYPNIYACGDVAGPYQFTHTAAHQAWYCAVNALFGRFKKVQSGLFSDPMVHNLLILKWPEWA